MYGLRKTSPRVPTESNIYKPGKTSIMLNIRVDTDKTHSGQVNNIQPNHNFIDEYLDLELPPAIHRVNGTQMDKIPFVVINVSTETVNLEKGKILGFLEEKLI